MQLLTAYIEPFTHWLHLHPYITLWMTFLIAFAESLAIIGSIIPGSITMTAIGILAGSGIIRIDLTLLCATLGAIAGDSMSYFVGYIFKDRLQHCWPFSRYPNLLSYGKIYFEKHGGKSVLIGRFVGPLRSIIPVIAGIMQMPAGRFFITNCLSGIGWAILYVTPGILIGAASHELSPERATRLVMLTLLMLLGIWLLSLGIKSLFLRSKKRLHLAADHLWRQGLTCRYCRPFLTLLTPKTDTSYAATALRCLYFFLCLSSLILLTQVPYMASLNPPVYFFLQSLHTHIFDVICAICQQTLTPLPIISIFLLTTLQLCGRKDWKGLLLWLSLAGISVYLLLLLPITLFSLPGSPLPVSLPAETGPDLWLTLATACYIGAVLHQCHKPYTLIRHLYVSLLLGFLVVGSVATLYLGDQWLTHMVIALLSGMTISALYWIIAHKIHVRMPAFPRHTATTGCCVLFLSTGLACYDHLDISLQQHQLTITQHVLTYQDWWHPPAPQLPLYSYNRLGKPTILFNIQYVGALKSLTQTLTQAGWHIQHPSLLHRVLSQLDHHPPVDLRPFKENLYINQKPRLTMLVHSPHKHQILRLQLWHSHYYVNTFEYPIWIGYVQLLHEARPARLLSANQALSQFTSYVASFHQKTLFISFPHKAHQGVILLQDPQSPPAARSAAG